MLHMCPSPNSQSGLAIDKWWVFVVDYSYAMPERRAKLVEVRYASERLKKQLQRDRRLSLKFTTGESSVVATMRVKFLITPTQTHRHSFIRAVNLRKPRYEYKYVLVRGLKGICRGTAFCGTLVTQS